MLHVEFETVIVGQNFQQHSMLIFTPDVSSAATVRLNVLPTYSNLVSLLSLHNRINGLRCKVRVRFYPWDFPMNLHSV